MIFRIADNSLSYDGIRNDHPSLTTDMAVATPPTTGFGTGIVKKSVVV